MRLEPNDAAAPSDARKNERKGEHNDAARAVLRDTFGFREFHPLQAEIIATVIAGESAVVIMPTGGGKSLCYQIPAMVRAGVGIVISPLIALMKDQVDALRQYGVRAAYWNSTLSYADKRQVERALLGGELDLLYVAPEGLLTEAMLALLQRIDIALFAIDEAHCISRWGHDFRPEYRQLSLLAERFAAAPRIALTATADETTRGDIAKRLQLQGAAHYIAGFDRPNIRYMISPSGQSQSARTALLRFINHRHAGESGIVYCLSRRNVDDTAQWLREQGLHAVAYHAGMDATARARSHDLFTREDGIVVVATIAFGMGIDKPDVRFVAHLNLPKSIESYYQETGRAGRDGLPASAWMRYGFQDVVLLRQMLQDSDADESFKRIERAKMNALLGLCESTACRREILCNYFGESYQGPCGNCDNCLDPPETWDGSEAAQKALSCAYRTGQRFGVAHLIDVLLGKDSEKVQRFRHHALSVHGIGTEHSAAEWHSILRQLTAANLLTPDPRGHGGLCLTEQSRAVLKGERKILLRKLPPRKPATRKPRDAQAKPAPPPTPLNERDTELFEQLRTLRLQLARAQSVPSYVIFHNATLADMAQQKPRDAAAMTRITGVGQVKMDRYGDAFLQVINAFVNESRTE
ncbi:MAG: DNA helicase RecQ [bacterium]